MSEEQIEELRLQIESLRAAIPPARPSLPYSLPWASSEPYSLPPAYSAASGKIWSDGLLPSREPSRLVSRYPTPDPQTLGEPSKLDPLVAADAKRKLTISGVASDAELRNQQKYHLATAKLAAFMGSHISSFESWKTSETHTEDQLQASTDALFKVMVSTCQDLFMLSRHNIASIEATRRTRFAECLQWSEGERAVLDRMPSSDPSVLLGNAALEFHLLREEQQARRDVHSLAMATRVRPQQPSLPFNNFNNFNPSRPNRGRFRGRGGRGRPGAPRQRTPAAPRPFPAAPSSSSTD